MRTIIRFLPLLLLPVLFTACAPPITMHYALNVPRSDSLAALSYDVESYSKKYDGHDGVYIDSRDIVEHAMSYDGRVWQANQISNLRFMILNPDAEWLTTFTVSTTYGQELKDAYVLVRSPDGYVRRYGIRDMNVTTDEDGLSLYRFAYPDVEVGTVIDEGYEIRHAFGYSMAHYTFPLQFPVPCEHISVRYSYPPSFNVRMKKESQVYDNRPEFDYSTKKVHSVYYEADDIAAVEHEPYSPYYDEMARSLELAVTGVQSTVFLPSWNRFADNFKEYALDRESFWKDRAGSINKQILKDGMTDVEKLSAITTWLQQNIEMADETSNYDYNTIIKEKKGNPVNVTGLGRLMLQKAGVESSFILIHSAEDGTFDPDFLTTGTLTIPAIYTKIDSKEYIVFPYRKNFPIDNVPEYIQGQQALRINEDGYNGFVTIPYGNAAQNTITENYTLNIDEDGTIGVREEKELRGSSAYYIRRMLEDVESEKIDELMKSLLTYDEGEVSLKHYELINQDDYTKPLIIQIDYEIDNLVTITPDEVVVQTAGLLSPSSGMSTKVDSDRRKNPIRIYYDEGLVKNISVHYPAEWNLTNPPQQIDYSNKFGKINTEYQVRPGELSITLQRNLNKSNGGPVEFGDLMEIIGRRSQHLNVPALIFNLPDQG